jgi:hypothetical protein
MLQWPASELGVLFVTNQVVRVLRKVKGGLRGDNRLIDHWQVCYYPEAAGMGP